MKLFDFKNFVGNSTIRQRKTPKKFFLALISFDKLKKSVSKIVYDALGEARLDKKLDKLSDQIEGMESAKAYQEQLKSNVEDPNKIQFLNNKIDEYKNAQDLDDADREILISSYETQLEDYNDEVNEQKAQIDDQIELIDKAIGKASKKFDYLSEIKDEIHYSKPEELVTQESDKEIEEDDNMENIDNSEPVLKEPEVDEKNIEANIEKNIEKNMLKYADSIVAQGQKNGIDELVQNVYNALQALQEGYVRSKDKEVQDAKEDGENTARNLKNAHRLEMDNQNQQHKREVEELRQNHASEIRSKDETISGLKLSHANEMSEMDKRLREQKAEYERKLQEQKENYEKQLIEEKDKSKLAISEKETELNLVKKDNESLKQRLEKSVNDGIEKDGRINKLRDDNRTLELERNQARLELAGEREKNEKLTDRVASLEEQVAKMTKQFKSFISSVQEMQNNTEEASITNGPTHVIK